jgi:hypothetical protein
MGYPTHVAVRVVGPTSPYLDWVTFAHGNLRVFVPIYIRRIAKPNAIDALTLQRLVRRWTVLSPLRIVAETFARITGMWAILLSSGV